MQIARRIFFFLMVNVLVMTTISIVLNLLGVGPYLDAQGINYGSLMIFCLVWGMGGAFISLLISKYMVKMSMGVKVVDPRTSDPEMRWLVDEIHNFARAAGITKMPEVGIYESPDVNAFATGATKNSSLVAVSTGLLRHMNKEEARGVLGHEVTHIANGDMVTMTLIQGVVNAFVMFLSRVIAFFIAQNSERGNRQAIQFGVTIVLDIVFTLLGSMVVAYYSRQREFRADAGGARFAGKQSMVNALRSLQKAYDPKLESDPKLASLKISGRRAGGFVSLFATHPPLDVRIRRLEFGPARA